MTSINPSQTEQTEEDVDTSRCNKSEQVKPIEADLPPTVPETRATISDTVDVPMTTPQNKPEVAEEGGATPLQTAPLESENPAEESKQKAATGERNTASRPDDPMDQEENTAQPGKPEEKRSRYEKKLRKERRHRKRDNQEEDKESEPPKM